MLLFQYFAENYKLINKITKKNYSIENLVRENINCNQFMPTSPVDSAIAFQSACFLNSHQNSINNSNVLLNKEYSISSLLSQIGDQLNNSTSNINTLELLNSSNTAVADVVD